VMLVVVFGIVSSALFVLFFFQAEDGIRDFHVTGVQTCALPISHTMGVGRSRLACTASADALLTGWAMMVALSRTRASYTTLSTYPVPPTACDRPPACHA